MDITVSNIDAITCFNISMSISRKAKDDETFTVRHFVHKPVLVWSLNKKKKKKMKIEVEKRKTEGWLVRLVLN